MAEIHILPIKELQPDSYFSDDEDKYISFDILLEFMVFATQFNQNEGNEALTKELIKKILRKQIQRENNYITSKKFRFGKLKLVNNTLSLPSSLYLVLLPF